MANLIDGPGIPLGLGMALAQSADALEKFAALPYDKRREIIAHARSINSKAEMQAYVSALFGR